MITEDNAKALLGMIMETPPTDSTSYSVAVDSAERASFVAHALIMFGRSFSYGYLPDGRVEITVDMVDASFLNLAIKSTGKGAQS